MAKDFQISVGAQAAFLIKNVGDDPNRQSKGYLEIVLGFDVMACFMFHIYGETRHKCVPQYRSYNSGLHEFYCQYEGYLLTSFSGSFYEKDSFHSYLSRGCLKGEPAERIIDELVQLYPDSFPWTKIDRRGAIQHTRLLSAGRL